MAANKEIPFYNFQSWGLLGTLLRYNEMLPFELPIESFGNSSSGKLNASPSVFLVSEAANWKSELA